MSVRETLARNTLFNAAGRSWEAVVGLVLVAYIVAKLGAFGYGMWAVVGAFTGYAALFDLGVGSAYAKYIAEHEAKDESSKISSIVSTGLIFYAVFGCLFVALLWPLVGLAVQWLPDFGAGGSVAAPDVDVREEVAYLVRWGLVLFAVSNCIAPFTAVQTGLQRMGVTNAISFGASLVKIVATVVFLESGFGVRGLLYANAAVLGAFGLSSIVAAFYLCPSLRISLRYLKFETFTRLFRFGWRTQVSRLSNLIVFETDVLVIALILRNLELAGLYRIGLELANKFRQVPAILISALVPAASDLDARNDHERIRKLYLITTKYVATVAVPLTALALGAAMLLMKSWQGDSLDHNVPAWVLRILAVGYLANILVGPGVTIALGMGRPDLQMKAGLIAMISNIALTITLVLTLGFWGIPAATAISMIISSLWFSHVFGRTVDVDTKRVFAEALLWPLMAAIPGLALCLLGDFSTADLGGRPVNLFATAVVAGLLTVSYLWALRSARYMNGDDLEFFDDVLGMRRIPGYLKWSRPLRDG